MATVICAVAFLLIIIFSDASKGDTSGVEFLGKLLLCVGLFLIFGMLLVAIAGDW